ncbi:MAG: hypothetical protein ACOH2J_22015 [Allorhizobium sp.]
MKNGVADPGRPTGDIEAVIHHPNADGSISIGNGMITTIATSAAGIAIERARHPGIVLKNKDRIRASNVEGVLVWYEVGVVSDRFSSIITATLNQV